MEIQQYQSPGEEIANSVLHGIGVLLGIAGLVLLMLRTGPFAPVYAIFAGGMILMFLASTMYHALISKKVKGLFRIFDHQAIYLFIAGTYTPYCLLALKGPLGWALFGFEWGLALTGVVLSALKCRFLKKVETLIFVLMGWAIIAGTVPLARTLPVKSLILLFAGGAAYTAGVFWYRAGKERLSRKKIKAPGLPPVNIPRLAGAHVVWHVFVLAGAVCHWLSIWFFCRTV